MNKPNINSQEGFDQHDPFKQLKTKAIRLFRAIPHRILISILIGLTAFLLYSPALKGYYIGDDFGFVQLYQNPKWLEWPKLFYSDWSQGIWGYQLPEIRPFVALSFMLDAFVWKANPSGYHLTNIFINACNSILLFFVVRSLKIGTLTSAIAVSLLFTVHPIHVEAVYWITGRNDLLPATFLLSSFLAFIVYRSQNKLVFYIISFILYTVGLFAKDIILFFPGLLIAYDLLLTDKRNTNLSKRITHHVPYLVVSIAYLFVRKFVLGSPIPTLITPLEFWKRQSGYLNWLFPPLNLQETWMWLLMYIFVICCLMYLPYFRRLSVVDIPLLFFGVVWYLISITPVIVTYVSPRHLYIPSIGICIMLAIAAQRILSKRFFLIVTIFLLTYYSVLTSEYINEFNQASTISRNSQQKVEMLASKNPDGSVLIVDIPAHYKRAWLWSWASPFVFRKPYSPSNVEDRLKIIERPETYYTFDFDWRKINIVKSLTETPFDGNIIYLNDANKVQVKEIGKQELQSTLNEFVKRWETKEKTSPGNPNDLWIDFWSQYLKNLNLSPSPLR